MQTYLLLQNLDHPQQTTLPSSIRPTELTVFPPTANPMPTDTQQQAKKAQRNNTCLIKWILGLLIALVIFGSLMTIDKFFPIRENRNNLNVIESLKAEIQVTLVMLTEDFF